MIDRLVFFPNPFVGDPPAGVEERWFTAADGVRLNSWVARSASARATLVWSHGNAGNIAGRADVLLALASRGLDVLAYDYRGYGKSQGRPSESGVYLDAAAAFDSERARGTAASRIVCFGESLGGAVSIRLASERPCAAVVVVSTFTNLRDVARAHYGSFAFLAGARFDAAALVGRLSVPFFAIHGDRDAIVPYALGEHLFALAREPKQFLRVPGAGHNDILDHPSVVDAIARFVAERVNR
jgi:uncharacterized protein